MEEIRNGNDRHLVSIIISGFVVIRVSSNFDF